MDSAWWRKYLADVQNRFNGALISCNQKVAGIRCERKMQKSKHSGEGAISLAAHYGAQRIILLGYDCQYTGGKKHWHGDHPKGLGNAGTVGNWANHYQDLARRLPGVEILNATRETALNQWPRVLLEDALR